MAWTETTLWTFGLTPSDGVLPNTAILIGAGGVLYGTTKTGGLYGSSGLGGTLYSLKPPGSPGGTWSESILWSFGGPGDGYWPNGVTFGKQGVLYATTMHSALHTKYTGDGMELIPPTSPGDSWTESILYKFATTSANGASPDAGVLVNRKTGKLYGVTDSSIFELNPPAAAGGKWRFVLLADVTGGYPRGPLLKGAGGVFFGTASNSGASGSGTVFSILP